MNCRRFRALHDSFLDDTLSGQLMEAMRGHALGCRTCAAEDAHLRRALLLVRNLTPVTVSPDFGERLAMRLASESRTATVVQSRRWRWIGAGMGMGVGMAAAALVAFVVLRPTGPAPVVLHRAIVVMPPAVPAEPMAAPAMFGTVASSLPVYPAMLLAQRATEYFAATHARTVRFQATR
jgi:hypothetical protein